MEKFEFVIILFPFLFLSIFVCAELQMTNLTNTTNHMRKKQRQPDHNNETRSHWNELHETRAHIFDAITLQWIGFDEDEYHRNE